MYVLYKYEDIPVDSSIYSLRSNLKIIKMVS